MENVPLYLSHATHKVMLDTNDEGIKYVMQMIQYYLSVCS